MLFLYTVYIEWKIECFVNIFIGVNTHSKQIPWKLYQDDCKKLKLQQDKKI